MNVSFIYKVLQVPSIGTSALSRISPRVRVRDSVSIVYRIAPGGYSWIWPELQALDSNVMVRLVLKQ